MRLGSNPKPFPNFCRWCPFFLGEMRKVVAVILLCLFWFVFFFCCGRDWLRFACPSLFGGPLQEISKHLTVFVLLLFYMSTGKQVSRIPVKQNQEQLLLFLISCGERGIRTPGTFQYVGFQDRCNRPLCHLSKFVFSTRMWSLLVWWCKGIAKKYNVQVICGFFLRKCDFFFLEVSGLCVYVFFIPLFGFCLV